MRVPTPTEKLISVLERNVCQHPTQPRRRLKTHNGKAKERRKNLICMRSLQKRIRIRLLSKCMLNQICSLRFRDSAVLLHNARQQERISAVSHKRKRNFAPKMRLPQARANKLWMILFQSKQGFRIDHASIQNGVRQSACSQQLSSNFATCFWMLVFLVAPVATGLPLAHSASNARAVLGSSPNRSSKL